MRRGYMMNGSRSGCRVAKVQSHEGGGEASDSCVNSSAGFNIGSPSSVSICSISGGRSNVDPRAFELLTSLADDKSPPDAAVVLGSSSSLACAACPEVAPVLPIDDSRSAETELRTALTAISSGIGVFPSVGAPTSKDGSMTGPTPTESLSAGLRVRDDDEPPVSGEPMLFDG